MGSMAALLASMLASPLAHAGGGGCCPGDLDGDGVVGAMDLAILLGGWGPCSASCQSTTVVGTVIFPDGTPVPDAVVVTDQGGSGVAGLHGGFGFPVSMSGQPSSIVVTAAYTVQSITYAGTKTVSPVAFDGATDTGPIELVATSSCPSSWLPGFGGADFLTDNVQAIATFDDGTGPVLYVGGKFISASGPPIKFLAKWDGQSWSTVGTGPTGMVNTLQVFDDGSGPALFVGGAIPLGAGGVVSPNVIKWNGTTWSAVGAGLNGTVKSLCVYDDGTGPALFAAGDFTASGAAPMKYVAKWNGSTWSPLGSGLGAAGYALAVFDDGTGGGKQLYVGGGFVTAGGNPANLIARWNGSVWSPLGSGVSGALVRCLATVDLGPPSGLSLFVGGNFVLAGGIGVGHIARWDLGTWSSVGGGVDSPVYALTSYDDGTGGGVALFVGGGIQNAGGVPVANLAKWNGTSWSQVGGGLPASVLSFGYGQIGAGTSPYLVIGGQFASSPSGDPRLARWGCSVADEGRKR